MGNNVISIFMLVRFRCNILILIAFVCGMKLRDHKLFRFQLHPTALNTLSAKSLMFYFFDIKFFQRREREVGSI